VAVQPDPRVHISASEQAEQLKMALAIRDDINRLVKLVNQIRTLKKQLGARNELLQGQDKMKSLVDSSNDVVKKLDLLEEKLHNPKARVTYDILAQPGGAKLYSQLSPLFDYAKQGDGAPTQGMREVFAEYGRQLQDYTAEFRSLSNQLTQLNEVAKKLEVPTILVPESKDVAATGK
jgi:phage shock protein A